MDETSQDQSTVRPAQPGDASALTALALRSKAHWGYSCEFMEACRIELSYDAAAILSERMRFFVLEAPIGIVGFYALQLLDEVDIELDALFVEPSCIGKGWGRMLIEHAKQVAVALGAARLIVQGDPNAHAFYLAAGGVLTGKRESASIPGRFLPTYAINLKGSAQIPSEV